MLTITMTLEDHVLQSSDINRLLPFAICQPLVLTFKSKLPGPGGALRIESSKEWED